MSIKTTKPVEDTEKLGGRAPEYYVPERIENDNGTAIKFADGTLLCTKIITHKGKVSTKWGNIYIDNSTATLKMGDFAVEFLEKPTINYQVFSNTLAWALPVLSELTNKTAPKYFLAS